jgi:hypothetical protein
LPNQKYYININRWREYGKIGYSDIQGGVSSITGLINLGNNIDINPQFHDVNNPAGPDGVFRTSDDGLTLNPGSPAIGTGEGNVNMGANGVYSCIGGLLINVCHSYPNKIGTIDCLFGYLVNSSIFPLMPLKKYMPKMVC